MSNSVQQELVKRYKDSQTCSVFVCRMKMSKISTFDGIKLYYQQTDMPSDVILEGLYKSKLQDSVQLQTVLALYDQEAVRNNGQTSYLRLKTSVKLHIDQMMRTRDIRVRNEVVERGSVTKSQKGKKANVERKVGECFQWKTHGQCSKGDSCSFSNDRRAPANSGKCQKKKTTTFFSCIPFEGTQTDGGTKILTRIKRKAGKLERQEWNSMPIQIL